jgi:predicted Fe-Mo cluster-binding NifX family protein
MMDGLIAFPCENEAGLQASLSAHFGHCAAFTLVDLRAGRPGRVAVLPAEAAHAEGGCLGVVQMLAAHGVQAVVAAGMGGRPLAGLLQAGIDVYQGDPARSIPATLEDLAAGRLAAFGAVCGGGSHHGHAGGGCGH